MWVIGSVFGLVAPLSAQIVNIEDKRRTLDTVGWAGQLDLSGRITQNTRRIYNLSAGLRVDRRQTRSAYLLLGNYNLSRANSDRFVNDGFGHLRWGQLIDDRWTWESFGQLQYNQRLRIGLRGLLGTGPRFHLAKKSELEVATGLLYMYEYNELQANTIIRRDHRLSAYLSFRYQPRAYLSFNSTSYYQPLLTAWTDARLSTVNTLLVSITERLRLSSTLSLVYDGLLARLTEDVPFTTYQWTNGLRLQF